MGSSSDDSLPDVERQKVTIQSSSSGEVIKQRPHNVPLVLLGGGILWFGWFGFNGSLISPTAVQRLIINVF